MVGGDIGPELTRVGSKVKPEWLDEWLRDPKIYAAHTAMPRYRFNDKQLGLLVGFLLAKTDSDLLANVHLDAGDQRANRARQGAGERTRLRILPRDQRHQAGRTTSRRI